MHHLNTNEAHGEKARCELHKNAMCCFEQILEAKPHKRATYLLSHKPSKYNKQNMLVTAGEVKMNSLATFSYYLLHMDALVLIDQQSWMQSRESAKSDGHYEWMGEKVREFHTISTTWWYFQNICYLCNLMLKLYFWLL